MLENKIKNEKLHFLLGLLIQLGLLGLCIGVHRIGVNIGDNIQESEVLGEAVTSPKLGRLIFAFLEFALFIVLTIFADKYAKKDQIHLPFFFGILGGTCLWQSIGEDAWHFSIYGTHMFQLESIEVIPLAVIFIIACIYVRKNHCFNWGIWCVILSFATNWMGHYVLEVTNLPFRSIIDPKVFMTITGCTLGGILLIVSLIIGLKKGLTVKQRFEMSVLCYFAIALIAFGIMEA